MTFRSWVLPAVALLHGAVAPARDLPPGSRFSLPLSSLVGNADAKVREMKAGSDSLWFLVEGGGHRPGAVVQTDLAGQVLSLNLIPSGARPMALTATAAGAAVLLATREGPLLQSFVSRGGPATPRKLRCAAGDGLFSLWGAPATFCSDGRIEVHAEKDSREYPSWARSGVHALDAGDGQVAFVERETARVFVQDVKSGTIQALEFTAPELDEALDRATNARAELEKQPAPAGARPGRPIVIMDAASRGEEICLLVWPYHKKAGPAVVCVNRRGTVMGRWRCLVPTEDVVHRIAVSGGGDLLLCSSRGTVFGFKR